MSTAYLSDNTRRSQLQASKHLTDRTAACQSTDLKNWELNTGWNSYFSPLLCIQMYAIPLSIETVTTVSTNTTTKSAETLQFYHTKIKIQRAECMCSYYWTQKNETGCYSKSKAIRTIYKTFLKLKQTEVLKYFMCTEVQIAVKTYTHTHTQLSSGELKGWIL